MMNTEDRYEFWRKAFEEQKASGLSVKEYCELSEMTRERFYYWKRKIDQGHMVTRQCEEAHFVELLFPRQRGGRAGYLEIMIGEFRIKYESTTDDALLRRAAAALLSFADPAGA